MIQRDIPKNISFLSTFFFFFKESILLSVKKVRKIRVKKNVSVRSNYPGISPVFDMTEVAGEPMVEVSLEHPQVMYLNKPGYILF
jgi:hypothetical protein